MHHLLLKRCASNKTWAELARPFVAMRIAAATAGYAEAAAIVFAEKKLDRNKNLFREPDQRSIKPN